jgi:TolB protein
LFTANRDGSSLWQLARFVEDQLPTWTQDGNEIIFLSRREGDRKSRLMKVGSNEVNSLGVVLAEGEYPAVGRDGRLAFEGWGATGRGLRTANTNVQDVIVVTTNDDDTAPALSPNGRQMAFMSRRDGNWEIYVINVDGTDLTRITEELAEDGLPAWSPDGRAIAFASRRGGAWAIWAVSPNGGEAVKLFEMQGSPDGFVGGNRDASRGWAEERISWTR